MRNRFHYPDSADARFIMLCFILLFLCMLFGCKKEPPDPPHHASAPDCEQHHYGLITITNGALANFEVYLDGAYFSYVGFGGTVDSLQLNTGHHELSAEEVMGAGSYQLSLDVDDCGNYTWSFP